MKHLITLLIVLCFALNTKAQNTWKPNTKYITKTGTAAKDTTQSIQCSGTTKKGERCKLRGKCNPNLVSNTFLCWRHINQQ